MEYKKMSLRFIMFHGDSVSPARVDFDSGLNLIYGASNTGKSFILKAIDFMFGGNDPLPDIPERVDYDYVLLGFSIEGAGDFTLLRSVDGGDYELYRSLVYHRKSDAEATILSPTQPSKKKQSVSQFLLETLGFSGKMLARNAGGVIENITIRDFSTFFFVTEQIIQSETSPVEGTLGPMKQTRARSFFRLLLTGKDDSLIIKTKDSKTFKTSKDARIEVLNELISSLNLRLSDDNTALKDIQNQSNRLSATLSQITNRHTQIDNDFRDLNNKNKELQIEKDKIFESISQIENHRNRFMQLASVYDSDISRLKAIEEAGFILPLSMDRSCDLCGAPPEAQIHKKSLIDIENSRHAAASEIIKVLTLRTELREALDDLQNKDTQFRSRVSELEGEISQINHYINEKRAELDNASETILEIVDARDTLLEKLSIINQREILTQKLKKIKNEKNDTRNSKPALKAPDTSVFEFSKTLSDVLKAWSFPGECVVSYDDRNFDVKIDGKLRTHNGKGVRAITHSAFKVALLIYCRENDLPHPGLIILDSPLVTYRDPMKDGGNDSLTLDEQIIAQSTLKECFFKHLSSISNLGQFIVLENVDPPHNIADYAHVEIFYGHNNSNRRGFF